MRRWAPTSQGSDGITEISIESTQHPARHLGVIDTVLSLHGWLSVYSFLNTGHSALSKLTKVTWQAQIFYYHWKVHSLSKITYLQAAKHFRSTKCAVCPSSNHDRVWGLLVMSRSTWKAERTAVTGGDTSPEGWNWPGRLNRCKGCAQNVCDNCCERKV